MPKRPAWRLRIALFFLVLTLSGLAYAEPPRPIGYYPGSFDPPNKNHFGLVADAIRIKNLEKVYVRVGPYGGKDYNLSTEERAALLQKVFDSHPETAGKVEVVVDLQPPKGFVDLVRANRDRTVYGLVGIDRADPERTKEVPPNVKVAVFPRAGEVTPDYSGQKNVEVIDPALHRLYSATEDISSTAIREAVAQGKPISHLVDPIVEKEIYRLHLYHELEGFELERAKKAFAKEARTFFREMGRLKGWDLSKLEIPPFKSTQTPAARREKLVRWIIEKRSIDYAEGAALYESAKPLFEIAHRTVCDWAGVADRKPRSSPTRQRLK